MTPTPAPSLSRRALVASIVWATGAMSTRTAVGKATERYTFAVLGTDYRTPEKPENADVIMVSRVDVVAGTVRTLSIPRDLYVEIPGHGYGKINGAFNLAVKADPQQRWSAGAAATVDTIAHNFGLEIDGVAVTDMGVFPRIVDALDGITVNNPYALTIHAGLTFQEGPLALDGALALDYVRSRKQDGDGGRVMRQHLVLRAILAKLQHPSVAPRVPELISTLGQVVKTTIPAAVQLKLASMLPDLSDEDLAFTNIEGLLWADSSAEGAWIYQGDWATLPGYVEGWLAGADG